MMFENVHQGGEGECALEQLLIGDEITYHCQDTIVQVTSRKTYLPEGAWHNSEYDIRIVSAQGDIVTMGGLCVAQEEGERPFHVQLRLYDFSEGNSFIEPVQQAQTILPPFGEAWLQISDRMWTDEQETLHRKTQLTLDFYPKVEVEDSISIVPKALALAFSERDQSP